MTPSEKTALRMLVRANRLAEVVRELGAMCRDEAERRDRIPDVAGASEFRWAERKLEDLARDLPEL